DISLNGPGTTKGNVGMPSPGTLSLDSSNGNPSVAIVGNVYLGNTANITHPAQVQGTIFTNQDSLLTQANSDAVAAAATFSALAPTLTVSGNQITGTMTINGSAGVNVLNITGLNLNHETLTLNAPVGAQFIINDSGGFVLNSGTINLTGGLTTSDVVYNITGSGSALSTSGGAQKEKSVNGNGLGVSGKPYCVPG